MPEDKLDPYFALIYEVGIINQIGTAFLEARLPKGLLVSHFGVVSHLIRVRDGATPLAAIPSIVTPGVEIWSDTYSFGFLGYDMDISPDGDVMYVTGSNGSVVPLFWAQAKVR